MTPHNPHFMNDEIMIMISADGSTHACGYKCSRCGKPVFPLGSIFPDSLLTEEELKILNDNDCEVKP